MLGCLVGSVIRSRRRAHVGAPPGRRVDAPPLAALSTRRVTDTQTDDTDGLLRPRREQPVPGVVLVFRGATACSHLMPLDRGALMLGRETTAMLMAEDKRMSRAHARVRHEANRWTVCDLESRNGTFVDGVPVSGEIEARDGAVVRLADSLFLLAADVRPFADGVAAAPFVAGPSLRAILRRVELTAQSGRDLLVSGETGSGKEIVASIFHASGPGAGQAMVSVNCATIPEGLAERLLFGARRGAYSGANADVGGLLSEAHGGVLFLDEVGELDLHVQAKLLRFLETREVTPLGAAQSRRIDVRICFATHRDLTSAVAEGWMREDFYHRIARPEVRVPPLRERADEIPWLVVRELGADPRGLTAHARAVEACMLHKWPGNVRELLHEVRAATDAAVLEGERVIRVEHLSISTGPGPVDLQAVRPPHRSLGRGEIEAALAKHRGNVTATATSLGMQRRQLYRVLARYGMMRDSRHSKG